MTKQPLFKDEAAVFMFHSKSKDTKPGKGTGEALASDEDGNELFAELATIVDWRKRLSNFDESPFQLDGLQWRSVEHCFQAQKFVSKAPHYYRSFSMDSNSTLSRQLGGPVKSAGGKRGGMPLTESERRDWERLKWDHMERVLYAKYSQNTNHARILLATGYAKLTHKPLRSKKTMVEYGLMKVRRRIRLEQQQQQQQKNKAVVASVQQIKCVLEKKHRATSKKGDESHEEEDKEELVDVLDRLGELSVNLCVLQETLIGKSVSKFKSHPNQQVSNKARNLIKKWRRATATN